jgi:hypothetical protein
MLFVNVTPREVSEVDDSKSENKNLLTRNSQSVQGI